MRNRVAAPSYRGPIRLGRTRSSHAGGFNLVELLVATAILVTGFLCLLGVFPTSMDGVRQAKDRLVATQLAQAYMDSERSKAFVQMNNGTYADKVTSVVDGKSTEANYTTVVSVSPNNLAAANKATIAVQVQWMHRGNLRYVSLGATRTRED